MQKPAWLKKLNAWYEPRRRPVLLFGVPGALLLIAGVVYLTSGRYVHTDNAYVKADKVFVSPQVAGMVAQVMVHENEEVKAGQVLFQLDPEPYIVALQAAAANVAEARNNILAAKATYRQRQAELKEAEDTAAYAQREYNRNAKLNLRDVVSASKYDASRHDLDMATQEVAALKQDLQALLAQLAGDVNLPVEQYPAYLAAQAAFARARLNLQYTRVTAPFSGICGREPKRGEYFAAGTAAMSLVANNNLWVEANFKETEITPLKPGQSVAVEVDTYPGQVWHGHVDSISQATGAEFSVLPAQNASGNWVKVVQRIPVRIALDADADKPQLRAGMSAYVNIDTQTFVAPAKTASKATPAPGK